MPSGERFFLARVGEVLPGHPRFGLRQGLELSFEVDLPVRGDPVFGVGKPKSLRRSRVRRTKYEMGVFVISLKGIINDEAVERDVLMPVADEQSIEITANLRLRRSEEHT